ncbi:MAG: DUF58 domain-containing protein [Lysobacteraceae bacterium]
MRGLGAGWSERLLRAAESRLPALTRLKSAEALPITLDRRRIYVLPTRFGIAFGVLLAAMTLGALNYNNNPALILCFLLLSVANTGLLSGYLALRGLRLIEASAIPVHAGQPLQLRLRFDGVEARARRGLRLRRGDIVEGFSLDARGAADVLLAIPTERRGRLPLGRIEVSMRRPLGMFVAWSWLHPQREALVYPALERDAPPLPEGLGDGTPTRRRGPDETVHSLRDYRGGDPLRSIAWKRSAQQGRTLVREFESPAGQAVTLDWSQLAALPVERRIQRLARWASEAQRQGRRSELRLPGLRLGPDSGPAHLHACLRALALLPHEETAG